MTVDDFVRNTTFTLIMLSLRKSLKNRALILYFHIRAIVSLAVFRKRKSKTRVTNANHASECMRGSLRQHSFMNFLLTDEASSEHDGVNLVISGTSVSG